MIYKLLFIISLFGFYTPYLNADNIEGCIVYSQGNSIFSMDLKSSKKETIYKRDDSFALNVSLSLKDNDTVFFSTSGKIYELKINDKSVEEIDNGILPSYIAGHDSIMFYKYGLDGSLGVFIKKLNGKNFGKFIIRYPEEIKTNKLFLLYLSPVVQVSKDKIMLIGADMSLCLYNIAKNRLIDLQIPNCIPTKYVSKKNEIIFADITKKPAVYRLLSVFKNVIIPGYSSLHKPIVYLPHVNSVLYNKTEVKLLFKKFSFQEIYPLYLYSLDNDKNEKILENEHMYSAVIIKKRSLETQ